MGELAGWGFGASCGTPYPARLAYFCETNPALTYPLYLASWPQGPTVTPRSMQCRPLPPPSRAHQWLPPYLPHACPAPSRPVAHPLPQSRQHSRPGGRLMAAGAQSPNGCGRRRLLPRLRQLSQAASPAERPAAVPSCLTCSAGIAALLIRVTAAAGRPQRGRRERWRPARRGSATAVRTTSRCGRQHLASLR